MAYSEPVRHEIHSSGVDLRTGPVFGPTLRAAAVPLLLLHSVRGGIEFKECEVLFPCACRLSTGSCVVSPGQGPLLTWHSGGLFTIRPPTLAAISSAQIRPRLRRNLTIC